MNQIHPQIHTLCPDLKVGFWRFNHQYHLAVPDLRVYVKAPTFHQAAKDLTTALKPLVSKAQWAKIKTFGDPLIICGLLFDSCNFRHWSRTYLNEHLHVYREETVWRAGGRAGSFVGRTAPIALKALAKASMAEIDAQLQTLRTKILKLETCLRQWS